MQAKTVYIYSKLVTYTSTGKPRYAIIQSSGNSNEWELTTHKFTNGLDCINKIRELEGKIALS